MRDHIHRAFDFARGFANAQHVFKRIERVHPGQNRRGRGDVPLGQNDMFRALQHVGIDRHVPCAAKFRHHFAVGGFGHKVVVTAAVGDQIGDGADFQPVFLREGHKVRQTRHGAIFVHDLTDHRAGLQPRQTRHIDTGLGVTGADQHTAVAGAQRENMPRRGNVSGGFRRVNRHGDGARAIMGGNPGGHALFRLDRNGECGFVARGIVRRHHRQTQRVNPFPGQRHTDQTAPMGGHEIDRLRRGHL